MRVARDMFLKSRLFFESTQWKDYYKKKKKPASDTRVANTIIEWFRKGMGLSNRPCDVKANLPMPWNYFDMNMLSILEYGHNRLIGVLGTIVSAMEHLIPSIHHEDIYKFVRESEGSGFTKYLKVHGRDSRNSSMTRQSRKAMKVYNSALVWLVDGRMWGIHEDVIELLRKHLLIIGRWFSPAYNIFERFKMRQLL